jgi:hypothetical protein
MWLRCKASLAFCTPCPLPYRSGIQALAAYRPTGALPNQGHRLIAILGGGPHWPVWDMQTGEHLCNVGCPSGCAIATYYEAPYGLPRVVVGYVGGRAPPLLDDGVNSDFFCDQKVNPWLEVLTSSCLQSYQDLARWHLDPGRGQLRAFVPFGAGTRS